MLSQPKNLAESALKIDLSQGSKNRKNNTAYQIGFSPINSRCKTPFSASTIKFQTSICYLLDQMVSNPPLLNLKALLLGTFQVTNPQFWQISPLEIAQNSYLVLEEESSISTKSSFHRICSNLTSEWFCPSRCSLTLVNHFSRFFTGSSAVPLFSAVSSF